MVLCEGVDIDMIAIMSVYFYLKYTNDNDVVEPWK